MFGRPHAPRRIAHPAELGPRQLAGDRPVAYRYSGEGCNNIGFGVAANFSFQLGLVFGFGVGRKHGPAAPGRQHLDRPRAALLIAEDPRGQYSGVKSQSSCCARSSA